MILNLAVPMMLLTMVVALCLRWVDGEDGIIYDYDCELASGCADNAWVSLLIMEPRRVHIPNIPNESLPGLGPTAPIVHRTGPACVAFQWEWEGADFKGTPQPRNSCQFSDQKSSHLKPHDALCLAKRVAVGPSQPQVMSSPPRHTKPRPRH